jgi:hypothetical protein
MKRLKIVKQIPDLQIEWATQYANQSLRAFLLETKGFSERQYRYILDKSPAIEWNIRKEEIQNKVVSETIDSFAEQAAQVHRGFIASAELATAFTRRALAARSTNIESSELLNLLKSLAEAQEIYLKAIGAEKGHGLLDIYGELLKDRPDKRQKVDPVGPEADLSYEDIMVLIEAKREMKAKTKERTA